MTNSPSGGFRIHALAAATAIALSAAMLPASASDAAVDVSGLQSAPAHDRFIVKYRDGSAKHASEAALQRALERTAAAGTRGPAVQLQRLRRIATGADVIRSDRKLDRVEAEALMRRLAADPDVEYVEVDRLMQHTLTPNDPLYASNQWHYFEAAGGIKANEAWDVAEGDGIVVAVLDTGITNHSDLNGNVVAGYDMISDASVAADGNGRDSDPSDPGDAYGGYASSWHGTHVAGTVAAVTNNGKGVAGVAPGAKIQPVRVLGKGGGYTSDIADGIIWASGGSVSGVPANANPAEVINLSLGGSGSCGSTTQNAINQAVGRGSTIVIAAGNSNADVANFSPGNCNNIISVASTTRTGARSSFSNYGAKIDFAAPGSDIASTINTGSNAPSSEGYGLMSGTSMAAPHVAGVVALVQSAAATPLTPAAVEQLLKDTARAFPSTPSRSIGSGIVNAKAAVDAASGGGGGEPPPPAGGVLQNGVPATGLSASSGSDVTFTMQVPAGASNLTFATSGGSGDADLYVRFGSAPTDGSYDCRPYRTGNNETCSFGSPQAGTYHVRVKAYSGFANLSLVGSYSAGGGGGGSQTYTNNSDYTIRDRATVESPLTVSGRSGNGPISTPVAVDIRHTYRGDLRVDLVAPDGTLYNLHNRSGGSADNIIGTYNVNLSSEARNGTWRLRVNDAYNGDTGYINSWSITF